MVNHGEIIRELMNFRCNVLTENNRFLFFGRIAYYDSVNQLIRVENYYYPTLRKSFYKDTPVKLNAIVDRSKNEFITVEGLVSLSMHTYMQITPVHILKDVESRQYFRQNVMSPSLISHVNDENVKHPCMVVNISGNGIAIQSRSSYEVGDRLWFRGQKFCDRGALHNVSFQVVRKQLLDNCQYLYGCQFVELRPDEEERLFRDIFMLQASSRSSSK